MEERELMIPPWFAQAGGPASDDGPNKKGKPIMSKMETFEIGQTSVETRDNHPSDQRLRRHGFRVTARPKDGPAVWERNGVKFDQEDAVELTLEEGEDEEKAVGHRKGG